jgi:hypothetical protein
MNTPTPHQHPKGTPWGVNTPTPLALIYVWAKGWGVVART